MQIDPVDIIQWLGQLPLLWGLVILGVSAAIEYVFPPFPGDTVTLAGAVMIGAAGWPWWAVMVAIVCGSVVGIAMDWRAGMWLEQTPRKTWLHRLMARPAIARAIQGARRRFERHGSWYILVNRFVPAFRSVFFIVSGMVGISFWRVLTLGITSVLLWTSLLLLVGAAVGFHLESLVTWLSRYSVVVWSAIVALVAWWFWQNVAKKWIARRSKK